MSIPLENACNHSSHMSLVFALGPPVSMIRVNTLFDLILFGKAVKGFNASIFNSLACCQLLQSTKFCVSHSIEKFVLYDSYFELREVPLQRLS